MATQVAPYGSWRSPITSDLIVGGTVGLTQVAIDGSDVYWIEARPTEGGRNVIVRRRASGEVDDVTPAPLSARTRVHEYGGGAYVVDRGTVYVSSYADQRLYRQPPGEAPAPLTAPAAYRYADGVVDRRRNRLVCVREDHADPAREPENALVSLDLGNASGDEVGVVIASGYDFYSSPRISPDGSHLAWLCWRHPNMPWDGTELWVGDLAPDGTLSGSRRVAGGRDESIFQPEWSPGGVLHFVSDRTGWWNLYALRGDRAEPLAPMEAELGRPQWVFGMTTYGFASAGRIVCAYTQDGLWRLASLDTIAKRLDPIQTPYSDVREIRVAPDRAVVVAGSTGEPVAVASIDLGDGPAAVLRRSTDVEIDAGYLSAPRPIDFPTEGGLTAHAFYYPPRNKDFGAPQGERPPLLVKSHGGPTGATSPALNLTVQYWTSRGFAVLDVNYGGSTGYGRAYRQRLNGQWGVVDVDDCVNGARYLVEQGLVDGNRLAISGGSAGGYTTLCALTFRDSFRAGASYYGVSDAEALARDTHKFESRYLDTMIGPYPARRDLYAQRSPINFPERLSAPVIFFQGLEDKVVPPSQAEAMVAALRAKGVPVAYVPFEGEQHGFRRAESIKRALDAELYFYSRVFGFEPADRLEPVEIENLS